MLREIFWIPNLLTLSRILLSPFILLAFDSLLWLFAIGFYAALTDLFDGFLARQLGLRSRLGAMLDPLADKLFILMFLIAAWMRDLLSPWMIGALLLRDVSVMLAIPVFLVIFKINPTQAKFAARLPGKIVTFLQFSCGALLILTPRTTWLSSLGSLHWLHLPFLLLFPFSLWTLVDYTRHYLQIHQTSQTPTSPQ